MRLFSLITFVLAFLFFGSNTVSGQIDCFANCNHSFFSRTNDADFFQDTKMNGYDIRYMKMDIAAQPLSSFIKGSCQYTVLAKQLLDTFVIEFRQNMLLDSVYVNNSKKVFTRANDHIYVPLTPSIATGTVLNIVFYYQGNVSANAFFTGTDTTNGLTFLANVSESFQAREWFPAKQLLNDKIDSADMWIKTDSIFKVGSNGVLKQVIDLPAGKRQYRWSTKYPMNYYMPSIAIADYKAYTNYAKPLAIAPDSIPILHYVVNDILYFTSAKPNLDKTVSFVEKESELFGLYPFYKEKYGHSQASIGGGMEHQTMSTMHDFNEHLVAHELAHQWFGDNVTCASWNDIWLNESFATYAQNLMMEKLPALFGGTLTQQLINMHDYIMSVPGGSVYVPATDSYNEGRIFDGRLSYNKGAAVLHMLRFEMQNDSLFFKTLQTYQQKFKDRFATTADFRQVAEQVSNKNLTTFFNQWIFGEGFPTFNVTYFKYGNDSLQLVVNQTTSMPLVTPFFAGLMEYRIKSTAGDSITVTVNQTSNNQVFHIPYDKMPAEVIIDPNNWIINRTGTIVRGIDTFPPILIGVHIFPNPVADVIYVRMPKQTFNSIRLLDVQGRLLRQIAILPGDNIHSIPVSNLPAGIYFVQLTGDKERVVERILKM